MNKVAEDIARAFRAACLAELDAPKPGNVHRFADGHGLSAAEFEDCADCAAAPIADGEKRVGARILGAMEATRAGVGKTMNFGIVLLCAPLAAAAERGERPYRTALRRVLAELDVQDTADCYGAIHIAASVGQDGPGRYNGHAAPACSLREAMRGAAGHNLIAQSYADDFALVFDTGFNALMRARGASSQPQWWPATAVYLAFLSTVHDSHVARKFGPDRAETLRRDAERCLAGLTKRDAGDQLRELIEFDANLKAEGVNPGTCADLTVATLFADRLRNILREGASHA